MKKIILATFSPFRKEAFQLLGIDFMVENSGIDESREERKNPEELTKALSKLKAEAVAKKHPNAIVVGMDSVGCFNGLILEKPKSKEEAFRRLQALSGNAFQFYTGVHIIDTSTNKILRKVVKTDVVFRKLSDSEIKKYLNQDPNFYAYSHGFDPLGHYSSTFVESIKGSYNNFTRGIPLETVIKMLFDLGYKLT